MEACNRALDIIVKKRDSKSLSSEEVSWYVKGIVDGTIPDYLTSAFLMAIFLNGMDIKETVYLTNSMIESGEKLSLRIGKPKFDKHSTGGVGDKVSLILAPLIASCGIAVPMLSGRSLGHTGGTLNKLESIPNMRIYLTREEIETGVRNINMVIAGQTEKIAPADKKIYSLRDRTGTIESIPLITSSILSKKMSEDIDGLVMDIKVGKGAFMKTREDAEKLAETMTEVARKMGIKSSAILTKMDVPLGMAVGTGVEVYETLKILRGDEYPSDLMDVTLALSKEIIELSGSKHVDLLSKLREGFAYNKFREFVKYQGGDTTYVDEPERFISNCIKEELAANTNAYVVDMDTEKIGRTAVESESFSQGLIFQKKVGDWVEKGDILAVLYIKENPPQELDVSELDKRIKEVKESILSSYRFGREPVASEHMVLARF